MEILVCEDTAFDPETDLLKSSPELSQGLLQTPTVAPDRRRRMCLSCTLAAPLRYAPSSMFEGVCVTPGESCHENASSDNRDIQALIT